MDIQSLTTFKRMIKAALLSAVNSGLQSNVAPFTARDLQSAFAPCLLNKASAPSDGAESHIAFGLKSVGPVASLATPREIVLSVELRRFGCRNGDYDFKIRMYAKDTGKLLSSVEYRALAGTIVDVSAFTKQIRTALKLSADKLVAFMEAACDTPDRNKRQAAHMQQFWR